MLVEKISSLSGKKNTMEIDVTPEQLESYANGTMLIQEAFPNLNADEREFLKTGITAAEWDDMFGEEESREESNGM